MSSIKIGNISNSNFAIGRNNEVKGNIIHSSELINQADILAIQEELECAVKQLKEGTQIYNALNEVIDVTKTNNSSLVVSKIKEHALSFTSSLAVNLISSGVYELKQDNMRHEYQAKYPDVLHKLKFYIGDVRDINSIKNAMHGVDYVYHAAALKQVPSCEFFPIEAVKTNVLGTENVLTAAIESGVKRVVCLSTDKAAYPVNAMGTSKAMMEKVIVAKSRTVDPDKTAIMCTRYGNVLASRGSVVPLFINQIKEGNDLTVTDPTMTRFVMTLEEAVDLVLFAFENGESGDIFVQKAPACTIEVLAKAVKELFNADNEIKVIGIRHGEKMYETLLTDEECANAIDLGNFYRVPADKRDLNYDKYFFEGMVKNTLTQFNSNNTRLMTLKEVKEKLMEVKLVRDELNEWENK